MPIDKNLFMYDLAVVAIMKSEGPYIKEWLDYHLLAGVNHFYIYDNDSPDNQKEILQPYIDAGLVTYIFFPGSLRLCEAYNDALKKYKFQCRYMAFIDGDEFIFPKNGKSIMEVADKILSVNENAKGLAIHWQEFGSNNLEKADYSKGVLERFTRRAKSDFYEQFQDSMGNHHVLGNVHLKALANPRYVKQTGGPHYENYFEGCYAVDESGNPVQPIHYVLPIVYDKIVINHYRCKSKEECINKVKRGSVTSYALSMELFEHFDNNDVYDDGILKYIKNRKKFFKFTGGGG